MTVELDRVQLFVLLVPIEPSLKKEFGDRVSSKPDRFQKYIPFDPPSVLEN